jgi:SAM-dependent methyltransferase
MEVPMKPEQVHEVVKAGYAKIAREGTSCCGPAQAEPSCCGPASHAETAKNMGYSEEDLQGPAASGNLGLGCGNPTALAALKPGETVLDLGSGAGFDALLAAPKLGPRGRFIGVDMTPEMLGRARTNAVRAGYANTVEFREGFIEDLPVASESVDVVISNCVINLSPDKAQVFREAYRVLKPGGRLAVSDIVLTEALPEPVAKLAESWLACLGGALTEDAYLGHIRAAGFTQLELDRTPAGSLISPELQDPVWQQAVKAVGEERLRELAGRVFSYSITAVKPARNPA